jgi:hypothetical protein
MWRRAADHLFANWHQIFCLPFLVVCDCHQMLKVPFILRTLASPISVHPWRTPVRSQRSVYIASFWGNQLSRSTMESRHELTTRLSSTASSCLSSSEEVSLLRYSQSTICACSKALLFYHSLPHASYHDRFLHPSPSVWSRSRRPCLRWCSETTALLTFFWPLVAVDTANANKKVSPASSSM